MSTKKSVLFVCLGNICRSPTGEAVMQHYVSQHGFEDQLMVDSAGTIGHHAGHGADERMKAAGSNRGYSLLSRSRKITRTDLETFDLVIAMDRENLHDISFVHPDPIAEVRLLSDFLPDSFPQDVPDPYYGGDEGFEQVLDMIEAAVENIFAYMQNGDTDPNVSNES